MRYWLYYKNALLSGNYMHAWPRRTLQNCECQLSKCCIWICVWFIMCISVNFWEAVTIHIHSLLTTKFFLPSQDDNVRMLYIILCNLSSIMIKATCHISLLPLPYRTMYSTRKYDLKYIVIHLDTMPLFNVSYTTFFFARHLFQEHLWVCSILRRSSCKQICINDITASFWKALIRPKMASPWSLLRQSICYILQDTS